VISSMQHTTSGGTDVCTQVLKTLRYCCPGPFRVPHSGAQLELHQHPRLLFYPLYIYSFWLQYSTPMRVQTLRDIPHVFLQRDRAGERA
jgi:hypothetical protein